ncbi:molybdenum cofactor synthesis 1 [Thraustotheca clavata]|uniref:GTP 3',8-cyclase n=1 Tax=Thraustotheca clavata TaxID=74557 RepID=A0A1V9ZNF2_9STRA|nr:molybdenum cofactor synthesis 1 [Thraustotheca clavata]
MLLRAFTSRADAATSSHRRKLIQHGPSLADFIRKQPEESQDKKSVNSISEMRALVEKLQVLEKEDKLVDTFGRAHSYLRISLTERCNLRCQYCMPAEGVQLQPNDDLLTSEEIVRLSTLFARSGVKKLRLTGGEPLIRSDIIQLCENLNNIPGIDELGITTNGVALSRHIDALAALGTRLNISLDTLDPTKFHHITRRNGFNRVFKAIEAAIAASPTRIKLNCVVMRDFNLNEVVDFVGLTKTINVDIRFIEWMPFDSNRWNDTTFVPFSEMMELLKSSYSDEIVKLDNDAHDTAKSFALRDAKGCFGFITSMSDHFCGGCNRLRLTADGNLKVCLFGNTEVSLRDAIRAGFTDDELLLIIQAAVKRKKFALGGHGDMYGIASAKNRPMILIGG